MSQHQNFSIRSKIWLVDDSGNVVFGMGRLKLLEAIKRTGSINAAAKELKMSYRAAWGRIRATEERLGRSLLNKNIGGASGGGSQLTSFAQYLLDEFRKAQQTMNNEADNIFDTSLTKLLW
jgi:molybdate transport system regulatory protein